MPSAAVTRTRHKYNKFTSSCSSALRFMSVQHYMEKFPGKSLQLSIGQLISVAGLTGLWCTYSAGGHLPDFRCVTPSRFWFEENRTKTAGDLCTVGNCWFVGGGGAQIDVAPSEPFASVAAAVSLCCLFCTCSFVKDPPIAAALAYTGLITTSLAIWLETVCLEKVPAAEMR